MQRVRVKRSAEAEGGAKGCRGVQRGAEGMRTGCRRGAEGVQRGGRGGAEGGQRGGRGGAELTSRLCPCRRCDLASGAWLAPHGVSYLVRVRARARDRV